MLKPTNEDDLFRESAMTFGEHLEELRVRLFRAVLWLAGGVTIGFFIGHYVVLLIQRPMEQALGEYIEESAKQSLVKKYGNLSVEQQELFGAGYVPDELYVEPSRLLNPLRETNSELSEKLPDLSRYNVQREDLTDARALSEALVEAGKEKEGAGSNPAARLWSFLSPDAKKAAEEIAANSTGDVNRASAAQLARGITGAIADPKFFDRAAFKDQLDADSELAEFWKTDKETSAKPSADQLRRMNWQAIHDAFRWSLAQPQPTLSQITLWRKGAEDSRTHTKALNPTEGFMIYVKAAVLAGFILSSYFVFRELWLFVAAGLYPHERRYVYIFLPFSVGLFIAGALLAFFVAFPPVLHFLFSFNRMLDIEPDPRISEWLNFALFLPFAFGLGFQLPLVMLFMNRIGLVSLPAYIKQWRLAVLAIFVLSMVLCPSPDPYSMLLMALPLTLLYFGGIALCHYSTGRKPVGIGE